MQSRDTRRLCHHFGRINNGIQVKPTHRQLKIVHNCLLEDFLFFAKVDILKCSISTLAKKENLLKDSYKQSSAACEPTICFRVFYLSS